MENTIVDLLQLNDNSTMTVASTEKKYISCIKINGKPILPPLINDERRKELNRLKQKAIEIELKLMKQRNKTSSEASSIKTLPPSRQSTPTRPATLNLPQKYPEKTYIPSESKTDGFLNQYSVGFHIDSQILSSPKHSNNSEKVVRSTLEQKLAAEENDLIKTKINTPQQSSIIEEQFLNNSLNSDSSKNHLGRWSPLKVEQFTSLRVELSNKDSLETNDNVNVSQAEDSQTTPETVTQSPNLMRQNSYTLLTPSPALLSFLESQKKDPNSERSHSRRKTWDLTKAMRNWNPKERDGCYSLDGDDSESDDLDFQSLQKYSSSLEDFSAVEKRVEANAGYSVGNSASKNESESISSDPYVAKKSIPKILKMKGKGKRTKSVKSVPSPKGNDRKVPSKKKEKSPIKTQGAPDFVPSEIKTELSELSNLLIKMKVDHERQKKQLEEKQQIEMKQLEIIFHRREAELLGKVERVPSRKSRRSIYSESLKGSMVVQELDSRVMGDGDHNRSGDRANPVEQGFVEPHGRSKRPHSARDRNYYFQSIEDDGDCNRRSKSMDYNEANQDTDLDFSFQDDFMPSKDTTLNNEYILESDSMSNFSSRSSTISSEIRPDLIPNVNFRKYQEISSEEYAKYNQAATVITAAAKGFLTRRLLRTAHVQGLITTLKDAITCATQLHTASDIGDSDIDLMRRLGRQIEAAWDAVYVVFFNTDIPTTMQLISADRERLKAAIMKTPVAEPKKKRISAATRKSLDRKRAGTIMSKSQTSTNGCTPRVRMCTKMTASYPSPYFSTKLK